jgi:hypothetical protein
MATRAVFVSPFVKCIFPWHPTGMPVGLLSILATIFYLKAGKQYPRNKLAPFFQPL